MVTLFLSSYLRLFIDTGSYMRLKEKMTAIFD